MSGAASYKILMRLPRRVRFRLWRDHRIDAIAIWLTTNGHHDAAIWTWKITGRWTGRRWS